MSEPFVKNAHWQIAISKGAANTVNPIREIVDRIDMSSIPKDKEFISLSIGHSFVFSFFFFCVFFWKPFLCFVCVFFF